jgi:NAD(P)H-flavin reductase
MATPSMAAPLMPEPWRIAERREETHGVFTFFLEPLPGSAPMSFRPGQFNMLYAFGTGESAISHSGDPGRADGRIVHTIRRVGNVTSALARLQAGDSIGVRGPFGTAWPMREIRGRDLVFVAGGIGLAPLRPAIYHALNHRNEYGRIVILAGARNPEELLYAGELEAWAALEGVEVRITVDRATEAWTGPVGVVTRLIGRAGFSPENAVALICGPEIMMRYTVAEFGRRGVPDERLFVTMERNMKCAVAFCGHCQLGPEFICKDGPVYSFDRIRFWFEQREC